MMANIFLTLQCIWVASLSFIKDDQCNFHFIKDKNRMKFDHNFFEFLATYQK